MSQVFTFKLNNDYESLQALSRAAAEFIESHSLPETAAYAVDLALEELVSNVIKYGYGDSGSCEIEVAISVRSDSLRIVIEDCGREFDPTKAPAPDIDKPLEKRKVGGLGIHLVRNVSEKIAYRRENGRNIVEIVIALDPESQKPEAERAQGASKED